MYLRLEAQPSLVQRATALFRLVRKFVRRRREDLVAIRAFDVASSLVHSQLRCRLGQLTMNVSFLEVFYEGAWRSLESILLLFSSISRLSLHDCSGPAAFNRKSGSVHRGLKATHTALSLSTTAPRLLTTPSFISFTMCEVHVRRRFMKLRAFPSNSFSQ